MRVTRSVHGGLIASRHIDTKRLENFFRPQPHESQFGHRLKELKTLLVKTKDLVRVPAGLPRNFL